MGVVELAFEFARGEMPIEGSHDFYHCVRVLNISRKIAKTENCDLLVVELAALLHDIEDWKYSGNDMHSKSENFLAENGVSREKISAILYIVRNLSFKGKRSEKQLDTIEAKIVRDADRLDALGAIGIARCFAYGGSKGKPLWGAEKEKAGLFESSESAYRASNSSSIMHFYEKLLHLKDLMLTSEGKKIAEARHKFTEAYLKEFFDEWNGDN